MRIKNMGSGSFVGDYGIRLDLVVYEPGGVTPVDISDYTALRLNIYPPSGPALALTHATNANVYLTTDGTDGSMSLDWPEDLAGLGTGFWLEGKWTFQGWYTSSENTRTTQQETLIIAPRMS